MTAKRVFSKEFHDFIMATTHLRICEVAELASLMFEDGMYTRHTIKMYCRNKGIKRTGDSSCRSKQGGVIDYIKNHCDGLSSVETAKKVNEFYGCRKVTADTVHTIRKNNDIPSGYDARFKIGQVSHNKGKKVDPETYERMKHSFFKKGDAPPNYLSVGSVVINTDGYLMIKIQDYGTTRERWKYVQRAIYEKYIGEIPEGYLVSFKDGNKLNFSLDNLICINQKENAALNNYRGKDPEIMDAAVAMVKLKSAIANKEG